MFQPSSLPSAASELSTLLGYIAQSSSRPRYAFMVLSLIAEVANPEGEAGPFVRRNGQAQSLRDYLSDSLAPMGKRDPRRIAMTDRVRLELARANRLPTEAERAVALIEDEVRRRARASGKTNLSRAVSELVNAGLLRRYYKGYAVDHVNRGGQRHAVYVLQNHARCLLSAASTSEPSLPGFFDPELVNP